MKNCILRGVPPSLRHDGWWLGPITPREPGTSQPGVAQKSGRYAVHALLLAGLIVISQLPVLSESPSGSEATVAHVCSGAEVLDFHAATGLRSFGSVSQRGVAL